MKLQFNKVKEFYKTFWLRYNKKPSLLPQNKYIMRYRLMQEENDEYLKACLEKDIVQVADALGDKLYILLGTILEHGMQDKIEEVFAEIHKSNMSKLDNNGNPVYRKDGKVMKSENFVEPNLLNILKNDL